MSNLYVLTFVNTNKGVVARFKSVAGGNPNFNRIWLRESEGNWRQLHFRLKRDWLVSGEYLEGAYNILKDGSMPFEDWW